MLNRIIREKLKVEVDKRLRDEETGFRKERSCTDLISTLGIILEQTPEWKSPSRRPLRITRRPSTALIGKCFGSCYVIMASMRNTSDSDDAVRRLY